MSGIENFRDRIVGLLRNDIFLLFASAAVIVIGTLYPFNFTRPEDISLHQLRESFENSSSIGDQINNVLLFMPFGFAIANILWRYRTHLILQVLAATFGSAALSTSVELLQTLLPSRSPTPADILNNSFGGLVGLICFYIWNSHYCNMAIASIAGSRLANSKSRVFAICCGYMIFASLVVLPWQATVNFSDWSTDFPLAIGNEPTGNRPWQGSLSQLAIADRALNQKQIKNVFADPTNTRNYQDSLIGYYQFAPNQAPNQSFSSSATYPQPTNILPDIFPDQTGQLPALTWRGNQNQNVVVGDQALAIAQTNPSSGVKVNGNRWLETVSPTNLLSQRLRNTSQFTVSTIVASADPQQQGPARIISLSKDPLYRNLTLGQEQENLAIRVRTPLTGQNGADIQLQVPGVFNDQKPHHLVVTYTKAELNVYVDKVDSIYTFNLLELLPLEQRLFYYAVTFIPIGLYLAFLGIIAQRKMIFRNFMQPIYIFLPSLLLETSLIYESGKSISPFNLGIGVLFTAGLPILLRIRTGIGELRRGTGSEKI